MLKQLTVLLLHFMPSGNNIDTVKVYLHNLNKDNK